MPSCPEGSPCRSGCLVEAFVELLFLWRILDQDKLRRAFVTPTYLLDKRGDEGAQSSRELRNDLAEAIVQVLRKHSVLADLD